MKVKIDRFKLEGSMQIVPSKSILHRVLIIASLAKGCCRIDNVSYSDDVLATINCLESLNCKIEKHDNYVLLDSREFLQKVNGPLAVNQSGSTLRFLIAIALLTDKEVKFTGKESLFKRPLDYYMDLANTYKYLFNLSNDGLVVKGLLNQDYIEVQSNISSQYVSAILMALSSLDKDITIKLSCQVVSKSYIDMTIDILRQFGKQIVFDNFLIKIKKGKLIIKDYVVEQDMSNMAYIDCFNYLGSNIKLICDIDNSIQGDKKYVQFFKQIVNSYCNIDLEDNIDLALILLVLASQYHGVCLTSTNRLSIKESDRANCLKRQFNKLGMDFDIFSDHIICKKQKIAKPIEVIDGCDDHRIVMAMTVLLSLSSGMISGFEAVNKSYPNYLEDLIRVGAKIEIVER